jgi:hypothetical protein
MLFKNCSFDLKRRGTRWHERLVVLKQLLYRVLAGRQIVWQRQILWLTATMFGRSLTIRCHGSTG